MSLPLEENRPKSINDAICDWNENHARFEWITPGTEKINELGKTLFFCYEAQKGYWLEEVHVFEKGLRWLNGEQHAETMLNEDQKTQLAELKKLYSLASQTSIGKPLEITREINRAKIEVVLGEKCARVYAILMNNNPDQQKIQEISPQLEGILESIQMLERKPRPLDPNELPDDFDSFKAKLESHIVNYFRTLKNNYKMHLLESVYATNSREVINAFKADLATENLFRLYFNKVLDSAPVELRLLQLEGCSVRSLALGSIFEDLRAFLQLKQDSLTQNDAACLRQVMTNLQFAFIVSFPIDNEQDEEQKEFELTKAAGKILKKLTAYSKQKEIPSGSIVIGGGCKNHAILYQIKKNDSGTYDLSLINTGDGATTLLKTTGKKCSLKSQDVVYTGLRLDELSELFFIELLHKSETADNMNQVYAFLDNALLNHSAQKVGGTARCLQKKGTCTVKCILEWLKTELGKDLFRDFSSYMLERAMQSVEKEAKTISPTAMKLLFPVIPEETTSPESLSEQLGNLIDAGKKQIERKKLEKSSL